MKCHGVLGAATFSRRCAHCVFATPPLASWPMHTMATFAFAFALRKCTFAFRCYVDCLAAECVCAHTRLCIIDFRFFIAERALTRTFVCLSCTPSCATPRCDAPRS